jgi:hypothetical protein
MQPSGEALHRRSAIKQLRKMLMPTSPSWPMTPAPDARCSDEIERSAKPKSRRARCNDEIERSAKPKSLRMNMFTYLSTFYEQIGWRDKKIRRVGRRRVCLIHIDTLRTAAAKSAPRCSKINFSHEESATVL